MALSMQGKFLVREMESVKQSANESFLALEEQKTKRLLEESLHEQERTKRAEAEDELKAVKFEFKVLAAQHNSLKSKYQKSVTENTLLHDAVRRLQEQLDLQLQKERVIVTPRPEWKRYHKLLCQVVVQGAAEGLRSLQAFLLSNLPLPPHRLLSLVLAHLNSPHSQPLDPSHVPV